MERNGVKAASFSREGEAGGIDGHELHEVIGTGGMGSIHRARQESLQRDVAVKVIVRTNPEDCDRFLREALVLAQLDHPNIVPIYDYGIDAEGRCFYTMKLVRGRTLKAILAAVRDGSESWTLERVLEVFRKVCDAVAFAHSRHVVHRDLKPDNVMVGEFGEVLVMDWGLAGEIKGESVYPRPEGSGVRLQTRRARAIDSDVEITLDGEVLGTPQYMSPEQAEGCCDLDERCDVYALGGILYTILTLRPPVPKGAIHTMLETVRTGKVEPFGAELPPAAGSPLPWKIPAPLMAVVRKAMALERDDRFASAGDLAADVDAHLAGYATSAEEINVAGQLWLLIKRHRTVSIALLVLAIVSALFVLQVMDSEQRAMKSAQAARKNEDAARSAEQVARKSEAATREALARSRVALADSAYTTNDTEIMRSALDAVPEDLRDTHWRYLNARADERKAFVAWQGDGFLIGSVGHPLKPGIFAAATQGMTHRIIEFEAQTGKILHSFPCRDGWMRAVAYSPDAKRIAVGRIQGDGISIHDAESGAELLHWKANWVDYLAFTPDGKRLLQSDQAGCVMWDASTGEPVWRAPVGMTHLLTPDGERVVCVSENHLRVLSAADGRVLSECSIKLALPISASLSPDGSYVVIFHHDGLIRGYRLDESSPFFEVPAGDYGFVGRTAFTPDGKTFISVASMADSVQTVQIRDAETGRVLRYLRGGVGGVESLSIHPLSPDLVITGSRSATWTLPQHRESKWKFDADRSVGGFLGGNDAILASSGAINFRTGSTTWKPSRQVTSRSATSFDGLTGVMQLYKAQANSRDFLIVRSDGRHVSEVSTANFETDAQAMGVNCDGTRVAFSGAWGGLGVHFVDTGKPLPKIDDRNIVNTSGLTWHGKDPKRLIGIFNQFGRRGAPNVQEWIISWDTDTGKRFAAERNPTAMNCIAAEPGGTRVAEAGDDKVVRIRDADTLAVLREFRAHDGPIISMAWNPKEGILATGSIDRTIRLWNVETGALIEELHIGLRGAEALYFSPSGKRLACVIPGENTLIWELN